MKLSQKLKWSATGIALACAASGGSALTLGRASGAAILGRPLELTVPVQVAADEEAAGLCFEADVFYGDIRQDPNRVTVTSETSAQGLPVKVRVLASAHVDEPVVTVYLRAACGRQATRRYVLLADLVSELAPAPAARPLVVPPTTGIAAVTPLAKTSSGVSGTSIAAGKTSSLEGLSAEVPTSKSTKRGVRARDDGVALSPSVSAKSKLVEAGAAGQRARLRLAPLDFTQERDPTLKISNELFSSPTEDMQKRGEAAALWRSLNATPQDVLRDGARLQAMESDLKALQDQTVKNRREMLDLVGRLDRAESQRYANPLVYGLLALLLACGAGLAYGWLRLRSASHGSAPWWRGHGADEKADHLDADMADVAQFQKPETKRPTLPSLPESAPSVGMYEVDIDLQLADSAFSDLGKPAPALASDAPILAAQRVATDLDNQPKFSPSAHGTLREISTEEMLDVRQQADFFMTLGQYDEAIGVLEGCINASGESNPLVYLDLLKVLHTLSKKSGYDHYRDQFNALFTGTVPVYASFHQQGNNLNAYPDICARIVELWPSSEALEYIEKCLVRAPGTVQTRGFDLEAFRDLLMLHGVIKRLASASESGLIPFSAARPSAVMPPSGVADMSVDLDLSEPMNNLLEFEDFSFLNDETVNPPEK
ncbi:MAG: hypothetical protein Q7J75_06100 [Rhodoferax sp.]|nr:hypothetical protein [Rhodoferax sp.]